MRKVPHHLQELGHFEPVAPSIWPRRVFHCFAGITIPLLILFLPRDVMQWVLIGGTTVAVVVETGRGAIPWLNDLVFRLIPVFKPKERNETTGSTFLILTATLVFFLFSKEIAVLSLVFLAVGDPMAALVGIWDPKLRVFGKSLVGTAAFVASASITALIFSLHADITVGWWLVPAAVVAGIAELLPLPLDDNILIPVAGACAMALLMHL